ncbi:MAG: shikimate kinase [Acidimicrobiales bacterium]
MPEPIGADRDGGGSAVIGHVVLVGLMGSGKTTVGKKVASLLAVSFVDADVEIEARTGRTVAEWFAEGEAAFRAAEADLLAELLAAPEPSVVGSGGGVVVTERNRRLLASPAVTTVYLHAPARFLATRARARPHRPLLSGDPETVLSTMYAERNAWYREVADAVVEVRPAHEAAEKPKWRLAQQVVEALVDVGVVDASVAQSPDATAPSEVRP